jgi:hypothetical protein
MDEVSIMEAFKFMWVILALPLGWLFYSIGRLAKEKRDCEIDMNKKIDAHSREISNERVEIANLRTHIAETYFNKEEVKSIISGTVDPLVTRLDSIAVDVKRIIDREIQKGKSI